MARCGWTSSRGLIRRSGLPGSKAPLALGQRIPDGSASVLVELGPFCDFVAASRTSLTEARDRIEPACADAGGMPLGRWLRFWLSVQRYCLRILVARDGNFPAAAEGAQHEPASVRDVENDAEQARLRLGGPIGCPVKGGARSKI
jgi:hypothetical protein